MDLIKSIHISSVEEVEDILKSEISVSSLFGELKHTPIDYQSEDERLS